MKKVVILFSMMLSFLMVSAKTDVVIDSSSAIEQGENSQSYQDGKELLKSMTISTGDALKTGYDIVVQQQRVYAIQYLLVGILCLIFGILFVVYYNKITKEKPNTFLPALLFLVGMVWTAIVFSMHYNQVIQGLINPDYAAIKDIIEMGKGLIGKQ